MTVTYVKSPNKTHIPLIPAPPIHPQMGPVPEQTTITTDGDALIMNISNLSQFSLLQPPSRDIPPCPTPGPPPADTLTTELVSRATSCKRSGSVSGYDKSTIEAVQVSVLIAMPQRPTFTGPLELGVVHVPLGHTASRWTARQSIRPLPP
jgi:hypothetical protein